MKTLIRMLIPGVLATLSVIAIAAACLSHAQSPQVISSPASTNAVPGAARSDAYMVCGVCGARIQQPQAVMVAGAYYDQGEQLAAPRTALAAARPRSRELVYDREPQGYCEPQPAAYYPQAQPSQVILGADGNYYRAIPLGISPAPVFDLAGDYEPRPMYRQGAREIPVRAIARHFHR